MATVSVGSNRQYSEGWDAIFKGKSAKKQQSAKGTTKSAAKAKKAGGTKKKTPSLKAARKTRGKG